MQTNKFPLLPVLFTCLLTCMLLCACGTSPQEPSASVSSASASSASASSAHASSLAATPSPLTCGALAVDGTQLVSASGQPVQLKGISTHGLAWFPQYVNEKCFATLKSWGCSVVRLAMYTAESGGYCTDGNKAELLDLVDKGVQYATNQDMYVIVDWHILSDSDPNIYIAQASDFFTEVSARYASHDNVIYEICNEPNGSVSWASIKSYAEQIIPIIRANDPHAVIIVGTPTWSQRVDEAAADPIAGYDNIMYALHFYAATHKDDLRSKLTAAHDAGLPLFVTEFGICDASGNGGIDEASAAQWIDLLDEYDISYIMWNLSNKAETSAVLLPGCTKTSGFAADDLSPAGKWLVAMLGGELPAANSGAPSASSQASTRPAPATTTQAAPMEGSVIDETLATTSPEGLRASYAIKNSWTQDGKACHQYELALTNESGTAVSSWSVDIPLNTAFSLMDGWNGNYSAEGMTLHISSKDYNGRIEPGATAGEIGFIVSLG